MKGLLLLLGTLMACGGADRAGAFAEPIDGPDTAAEQRDGAVVDDTGDVPSAETGNIDASKADGAPPPKEDAPAPGCPGGTTAPPPKCPEICNGGCAADACRILCNGLSSCGARRVDCPPGMKCLVECSGLSSCGNLDLRCPESSSCALQCTGTSSCGTVQMRCPKNAPCALTCGGLSSCNGTQVACGAGACSAQCTAVGSGIAKLDCGPSCMCTNKC